VPQVTTRALVLHAFPYGDTSRILRLLTPDLGLRSVIAKGAQRPKSRFGALLEPFTEGEAQFHLRENRDLLTLSGFSLLRSRQGIGRDLAAFSGASLLAELGIRFATEEGHPPLYDLMCSAFDRLASPTEGQPAVTALTAVWAAIALLGFEPELGSCVRCGRVLHPEEPGGFDVEAGGVTCRACRPAGRVLDPATRAQVHAMTAADEPPVGPGELGVHAALLSAFLSYHLAPERPLRSLPLFLEHLR
jgi:DNA repair protein RecO (recombination protein O)